MAFPPAASISAPAAEANGWLVITMPRLPVAGLFLSHLQRPFGLSQEFLDHMRWRFDVVGSPADAQPGQATQLDRGFGSLHDDGNPVDHRGAIHRVAANAGKQQHRDAAPGDQYIDALGHQRFGLIGKFSFHLDARDSLLS